MNEKSKPAWKSKTMWGGVMMLVALILAQVDVQLGEDERAALIENAIAAIEAGSAAVGILLVIVGRFLANDRLTLKGERMAGVR